MEVTKEFLMDWYWLGTKTSFGKWGSGLRLHGGLRLLENLRRFNQALLGKWLRIWEWETCYGGGSLRPSMGGSALESDHEEWANVLGFTSLNGDMEWERKVVDHLGCDCGEIMVAGGKVGVFASGDIHRCAFSESSHLLEQACNLWSHGD